MQLLLLPLSIFLLPTTSAFRPILAPFDLPELEDPLLLSNVSLISDKHELKKRDGNCPVSYNSCSTLAAADGGACCTVGSRCTLDNSRNIACCPIGAKCTGTIDRSTGTTGGAVFGSATATTTSATGTITSPATTSLSYLSNAFFPFPIIATEYPNTAACLSAYTACQSNYAACTNNLQGSNGFAVTIVAPGGGVTVAPTATAQNLGISSATSICSSLSSQACYGVVSSNCNQFGTAFVVVTTSNPAPRPTMGCFATAGMVVGLGLGLAGQLV